MKTLLTGMPYKPSTLQQDVQATWRKHGWKPAGEKNVQHAKFGHKHAKFGYADDYDLVQSHDWLEIGAFK